MKTCPECKKEVDWLGRSGVCAECGMRHMLDAMRQLKAKSGPYYDKWKIGVERARERRLKKHG